MSYVIAVTLLLAAGAQAPSADEIARQINSHDPRVSAWGAYNAAAYHRVELIPRIRQALETPPGLEQLENRAFIGVVMDALIQLNARVPARLLVRHHHMHPVQTFVLLSHATDRDGPLLELLPRLTGTEWFAAANMLLDERSPRLMDHLLRGLKLRLTVYVTDDENAGIGGGDGFGTVGIGCGVGQDPPDYPPHAEYRFQSAAQPGSIVLAPGPTPVYYSRVVTTTFQYGVSYVTTSRPTDEDRVEYLRAMSMDSGGLSFRAHSAETVMWSTPESLTQRVQELRDLVERRFQSLVYGAQKFRSLPISRVGAPPIELHIVDRRSDKAVPLPKIGR